MKIRVDNPFTTSLHSLMLNHKPLFMQNETLDPQKKMENLSEEQKLELFKVEELEERLEMAAAAEAESSNRICWLAD
jgi:hypothetical protein